MTTHIKHPLARVMWGKMWWYARYYGLGVSDIKDDTPVLLRRAIECRVLRGLAQLKDMLPNETQRRLVQHQSNKRWDDKGDPTNGV